MLTVGGRKVQIVADITLCKNNGFNIVMIGKFPKCKTLPDSEKELKKKNKQKGNLKTSIITMV